MDIHIIPANPNIYDVIGAFNEIHQIDWKNQPVEVGDYIYIYVGKPYQKVCFLTKVVKNNITFDKVIDDRKYWKNDEQYIESKDKIFTRLELVANLIDGDIKLADLYEHGLKGNIQSRRKLSLVEGNSSFQWSMFLINQTKKVIKQIDGNEVNKNKKIFCAKVNYEISLYHRNHSIVNKALAKANYQCEYDKTHSTFNRKSDGNPYMEGHHLIPLSYQNLFDVNLDIEENIISLCSYCHRKIHHGIDNEELLFELYCQRKYFLKQQGIDISFEELLEFYK